MDNIVLASSSTHMIQTFIPILSKEFDLRDPSNPKNFLGLEVKNHDNGIIMSQ